MSRGARALMGVLVLSLVLGGQAPLEAQTSGERRSSARSKVPAPTFVARDALARALRRGSLSEARYALKRAESLFRFRRVKRQFGDVERPDPHAATLLLRDLALRVKDLSGEDLAAARAILARPDDPEGEPFGQPYAGDSHQIECSADFDYCLHWADPGDPNAPVQTDQNGDGRPDFVEDAIATMDHVWETEVVALGYRPPKSDVTSGNKGPDGKTDVYLADIGSDGVYGYCSTDDPNAFKMFLTNFNFSAYCVLDNDYAEFPGTPLGNLQVTAAHEFFHAIQFAYDAAEDVWLLEGTATAMEDIVYDDVNDNFNFLVTSQLTNPSVPLDWGPWDPSQGNFGHQYGSWLWWRFMTEFLSPTAGQRDDSVLLKIWQRADSSPGALDEHSLRATKKVAKLDYDTGFKKLFSAWGAALRKPDASLEEGAEYVSFFRSMGRNGYAPLTRSFQLSGSQRGTGWFAKRLDHLSSRYYRFRPGTGVRKRDRLKVVVNGPNRKKGTAATLLYSQGGASFVKKIGLNKWGNGKVGIRFPDEAILILQNASTRITAGTCYRSGTPTACMGIPKDDDLRFRARGKLIRP